MSRDTMLEIALSAENDLMRGVVNAANRLADELKAKDTKTTITASPQVFTALEQLGAALKRWNDWSGEHE